MEDKARYLAEGHDDLPGKCRRMPPFSTGLEHIIPFSFQTTVTVSCPTKATFPLVQDPMDTNQ